MPVNDDYMVQLIAEQDKRGVMSAVRLYKGTHPVVGYLRQATLVVGQDDQRRSVPVYYVRIATQQLNETDTHDIEFGPLVCEQIESAMIHGDAALQPEQMKCTFATDNDRDSAYGIAGFLLQLVQAAVPPMTQQGVIDKPTATQFFNASQLLLVDLMKQAKPVQFALDFRGTCNVTDVTQVNQPPRRRGDGDDIIH
jgi:hypothetical protein